MWLAALLACAAPERPSVLLITLDTTRADRLGAYGDDRAHTPTWDALAAEGVVFERAYTVAPLTIPSHATLLTGLLPTSHGVRGNGTARLPDDVVTLAERFSSAGYRTAAFTAAFPTRARWGFAQGFDVYDDDLDRPDDVLDYGDSRRAGTVVDDAVAWVQGDGGPAFVWVHLFDAHWPYDPPSPWREEYADDLYRGEIAYADAEAERLIDAWDARYPRSVVAVVADHGEALGEGGELSHGFLLEDGTVHVPLIVRGEGVPEDVRDDDVASTADVAPTLAALAGLPPGPPVDGRDLLAAKHPDEVAWSEATSGALDLGLAPLYASTDERGRYTLGAWGAFYPFTGSRVATIAAPAPDDVDARLRAHLADVSSPTLPALAGDAGALAALGYLATNAGDLDGGDVDPRDVVDVLPLTWDARSALDRGDLPRAAGDVDALEARMPGADGVVLLRAMVEREAGAAGIAEADLATLYAGSGSPTVALELAATRERLGDVEGAEDVYTEVLEADPANPQAAAGLVRVAWASGEPDVAEEIAENALARAPDDVTVALLHAELLLSRGDADDALAEARRARERMPASPEAAVVHADAAWDAGRPDEAIDALQDALAFAPYALAIRARLADRLLDAGRAAEAARLMAPTRRLAPDDPDLNALADRADAAVDAELRRTP